MGTNMVETVSQQIDPNELSISTSSHDLFLDIVNTIPIEPNHGRIRFFANGIKPLGVEATESEIQSYIEAWDGAGIVPFTRVNFIPNDRARRGFMQYNYGGKIIEMNSSNNNLDSVAISRLIKGGKMHTLEFAFHLGFKGFKEGDLTRLVEEGYKINNGILMLMTKNRYHSDISHTETAINLSKKGVNMKYNHFTGDSINDTDRATLSTWFEQLRAKYE